MPIIFLHRLKSTPKCPSIEGISSEKHFFSLQNISSHGFYCDPFSNTMLLLQLPSQKKNLPTSTELVQPHTICYHLQKIILVVGFYATWSTNQQTFSKNWIRTKFQSRKELIKLCPKKPHQVQPVSGPNCLSSNINLGHCLRTAADDLIPICCWRRILPK